MRLYERALRGDRSLIVLRLSIKRVFLWLGTGVALVLLVIAGVAGVGRLVNAVFAPLIELALRLFTPA
jgi:hypothetical protein